MEKSQISWLDGGNSFNPWIGCAHWSPGCSHCYAEVVARKLQAAHGTGPLWGPKANRHVTSDLYWKKPLSWAKRARKARQPTLVFCASMADVFEDHPVAAATRPRLFELIDATRCRHPDEGGLHWLLLSKRIENALLPGYLPSDWGPQGYHGVWIGCTIEGHDQAHRADILRRIPAHIRWISYEPALSPLPIDFDLTNVAWLVAGGESGVGFRQDHIEWYRRARDLCYSSPKPVCFFMKQRAHFHPGREPAIDGREYREFPAVYRPRS